MTGRVFRIDAATHKVADALLPWFVNGTLEGDELALVQRHLGECPRCQHEVEWLRELHAACIAGEATPGASTAFRKLRRQLEQRRASRGPIARLRAAWTGAQSWSWAMAAGLVVTVVLGTLLVAGNDVLVARDDAPGAYRTLGAASSAAPPTGSLVVVFDPATTEGEINRILRGAGARIVDGPTQADAYVLDVPSGQTDRAARAIRAERAAVLVERLDRPGSR